MTGHYSPVAQTTSGKLSLCEALSRINTCWCNIFIFREGCSQKCPVAPNAYRAFFVCHPAIATSHQGFDYLHQPDDICRPGITGLRVDNRAVNMRHDARYSCFQTGLQDNAEVIEIDTAGRLNQRHAVARRCRRQCVQLRQGLLTAHWEELRRMRARVQHHTYRCITGNAGWRALAAADASGDQHFPQRARGTD